MRVSYPFFRDTRSLPSLLFVSLLFPFLRSIPCLIFWQKKLVVARDTTHKGYSFRPIRLFLFERIPCFFYTKLLKILDLHVPMIAVIIPSLQSKEGIIKKRNHDCCYSPFKGYVSLSCKYFLHGIIKYKLRERGIVSLNFERKKTSRVLQIAVCIPFSNEQRRDTSLRLKRSKGILIF